MKNELVKLALVGTLSFSFLGLVTSCDDNDSPAVEESTTSIPNSVKAGDKIALEDGRIEIINSSVATLTDGSGESVDFFYRYNPNGSNSTADLILDTFSDEGAAAADANIERLNTDLANETSDIVKALISAENGEEVVGFTSADAQVKSILTEEYELKVVINPNGDGYLLDYGVNVFLQASGNQAQLVNRFAPFLENNADRTAVVGAVYNDNPIMTTFTFSRP